MKLFDVFILISLAYVGVGVWYFVRVVRGWRALWDDDVTADDLKLARAASFYVLVPPAVLLHELGHAVAVWALGGQVLGFRFLGYMGWVVHRPFGPPGDFWVALAGNVVTLAIGLGALAFGLRRPGHPVRNTLAIELGRQSLFLVLAFYPAICLQFEGDFQTIYAFRVTPVESTVTALLHAALVIVGWGVLWPRRWRARAALLESPIAGRLVAVERRLADAPDELAAHRELGLLLLTAGDHRAAEPHLSRVFDAGRADARTKLALGTVLAERGAHERAMPVLREALDGLLRPEDRLLAELPLARALLGMGRVEEARPLIEALMTRFPRDVRVRALADRLPKAPAPGT